MDRLCEASTAANETATIFYRLQRLNQIGIQSTEFINKVSQKRLALTTMQRIKPPDFDIPIWNREEQCRWTFALLLISAET
jgi:hypothetical protein